jgi:DNA-binding transcriptional MerR regulator
MADRRKLDPEFATMADIMEAAGLTRRAVRVWIAKGLLTKPTKVSHGYPSGVFNRFPAHVLDQVRFAVAMREQGVSLDEIAALVAARDWTKGGLPSGPTVRSRGDAPAPARPAKRRRRP